MRALFLLCLCNFIAPLGFAGQIEKIIGPLQGPPGLELKEPPPGGFSSVHVLLGFIDSDYLDKDKVRAQLVDYLVRNVGPDPRALLVLPVSRQGLFPIALEVLGQPEFRAIGYRLGIDVSAKRTNRELRLFDSLALNLSSLDACSQTIASDLDALDKMVELLGQGSDSERNHSQISRGVFLAEGGGFASKFFAKSFVKASLGEFQTKENERAVFQIGVNHNPEFFQNENFVLAGSQLLSDLKGLSRLWPKAEIEGVWCSSEKCEAIDAQDDRLTGRNRYLEESRLPFFYQSKRDFSDGSRVILSSDGKELSIEIIVDDHSPRRDYFFKFLGPEPMQLVLAPKMSLKYQLSLAGLTQGPQGLSVKVSASNQPKLGVPRKIETQVMHIDWPRHPVYSIGLQSVRFDRYEAQLQAARKMRKNQTLPPKVAWLEPSALSMLTEAKSVLEEHFMKFAHQHLLLNKRPFSCVQEF